MKKERDKYVIKEVGNYQLCVRKANEVNVKHSFIVPLNYMNSDKIIKSRNKTFLVLRHAIIEDFDFLNFAMNTKEKILMDVNANHIVMNIEDGIEHIGESKFVGELMYMSLEQVVHEINGYKIIIELNEIALFCKIKDK